MKGKIRLKAKTKLKALQDRLGPKLGFLEVDNHEVSSSAVSSTSDLTTEPEPAPENPPEVLYSSEAKCGVDVSGKSQQAPHLQTESDRSLWDWAYDDLRHADSRLIDAFESILAKESNVEPGIWADDGDASRRHKQMSALVDKQLADMDRKEWRVKVGEKSVNLRDQVDRIIKVVVVVKDLMSSAASLDPVHAGLPCAGVCLLLQLVVNSSEQCDAAAGGLQFISMLVLRYAEIERIYLQGEEYLLKKDLEMAVKELYRQILKYEAAARSEEACEKVKDTVDTQDRRARTTQLESQLQKQTLKIDELLQVSRVQDEKLLAEIKTMREDQNVIFQTEVENKCLGSLRITLYEETKAQNPDRVPGTCERFLQHPTYREWFEASGPNLLWVTADPGCGKSVLSKSLVVDYTSRMSADTSVCYFFFKDNSTENRSAEHALCAILHQLFRQNRSPLQYAVAAYKSNGDKLPISFRLLWSILMSAAADLNGGSIICVIDALDECAESSSEQLIQRLTEFHSTRNNTKMCQVPCNQSTK
ncbi:hypothetical protein VTN00DRAFT_5814 [Thermoascus crustaceus]|uniref:uncharacterized protein n=1 Tax=Thermoascus crustaceus TaxID=5088 RepID=UPI0037430656